MTPAKYISEIILKENIDPGSYLHDLPVIQYLRQNKSIALNKNITFFVGENGTGKSTLLEAIAIAYGFNAEGGTVNFRFSTKATHSELWKHLLLVKRGYAQDGFFLRAESFYNLATNIDDIQMADNYGGKSLHDQSHGESFLAVVKNRFRGQGLYILDEPEAALSPMRLLTLMIEIDTLVKADSQFIISTHSPLLMAMPGSEIFQLSATGIDKVDYRETEHYQITKGFLDDPERMMYHLLGDDRE